jgi:HK97 family phage prohead protease
VAAVTVVVVGCLADELGAVSQLTTIHVRHAGRNFDVRREFSRMPSTEYRFTQASEIRVDVDHERPVGEVKHLELSRNGNLFAVCEIDGSGLEGPLYYSPEVLHRGGKDIELRALAVTRSPASVGLGPLTAFPGTLAEVARGIVYQDGWTGQLVKRAHEHARKRKHNEPIIVVGLEPKPEPARLDLVPTGPIEVRTASTVDVSHVRRTIELVVMPYETPTSVAHHGRTVTEIVSRGAFDTIARDGGRVRVNRDHDVQRTIGRAVKFDPNRHEGLIGEVRIARTALGDESLALADDGILDVSAGFGVLSGGERWETHSRRRLTKLWLDHVALTPIPAYESARVLAVRNGQSRTPNLDRARQLLAELRS